LTVAGASAAKVLAVTTSTGIGTSAPRARIDDHRLRLVDQVGLGQRLADLQAGREQEGVGDAAADDQLVDVGRQALQDGELGADLGARDDRHQRALGLGQRLGDGVGLGRQQRAGARHLGELRDAVGGGLSAVRGAEGVVDVDVGQRGELARERLVVLLLALVEAAVLEQHDLAGLHVDAVDPVRDQRHLAAQQLAQALRDRRQRILGLELALGRAAQVRGDHHRGTGVERQLDAGHRGADAGVLGDVAGIVLRHVEVGTDEDALAGGKHRADGVGLEGLGDGDQCHRRGRPVRFALGCRDPGVDRLELLNRVTHVASRPDPAVFAGRCGPYG